ncbi:MAG: hypothetical protein AAGA76_06130, partial [Pseudomonadota bacterium]
TISIRVQRTSYIKMAEQTLRYGLLIAGAFSMLVVEPVGFTGPQPVMAQSTSNCFAQPTTDLNFSSSTLISGTNLQPGARYVFRDVTGGGNVDSIIEVLGFSNGASLNAFDNDAGLTNNFQPELNAAGGADSGVDFRIEFYAAVTPPAIPATPIVLDIAINSIDVDGNGDPAGGAPGDLREYVEYETTLNQFILNNPTELDMNASGPSSANRIRFESRTSQFAPGIDPTASENIVAGLYTNVSQFEFRVGAIQTGAAGGANTRLTSLGFNCPTFPTPDPPASVNSLTVTKVADLTVNVSAGQTVTYTYEVENTGTTTLTDISLVDAHNGSGPAPNPGSETLIQDVAPVSDSSDGGQNGVWDTLGPGDIVRFTATYTVTQTDIDTLQ